jgi:hypothetical protein
MIGLILVIIGPFTVNKYNKKNPPLTPPRGIPKTMSSDYSTFIFLLLSFVFYLPITSSSL